MSIGRRVRTLREQLGLSQDALAGMVGVERTYISLIETDKRKQPSIDVIKALARALETTTDDLTHAMMGSQKELPTVVRPPGLTSVTLVRVVSEVSAGGGFVLGDEWRPITPPTGASQNLVAFVVRGDCMAPELQAGDTVIVDLMRDWQDGDIVLVRVDTELMVKRAYHEDHSVHLQADAEGYADIGGPDIDVKGVVILIQKAIVRRPRRPARQ